MIATRWRYVILFLLFLSPRSTSPTSLPLMSQIFQKTPKLNTNQNGNLAQNKLEIQKNLLTKLLHLALFNFFLPQTLPSKHQLLDEDWTKKLKDQNHGSNKPLTHKSIPVKISLKKLNEKFNSRPLAAPLLNDIESGWRCCRGKTGSIVSLLQESDIPSSLKRSLNPYANNLLFGKRKKFN